MKEIAGYGSSKYQAAMGMMKITSVDTDVAVYSKDNPVFAGRE